MQKHNRIYGNLAYTTVVQGKIEEIRVKKKNDRNFQYLFCSWSVKGKKKRVEVPLGQLQQRAKFSKPDSIPDQEIGLSHLLELPVSTSDAETPIGHSRSDRGDARATLLSVTTGNIDVQSRDNTVLRTHQ